MMLEILDEALVILNGNKDLSGIGKLLHEAWQIKRGLTNKISNPQNDSIYSAAIGAGALGGKLMGAGGGGFMLIFAKPHIQPKIIRKLKNLLYVPFKFENLGSQTIFYSMD